MAFRKSSTPKSNFDLSSIDFFAGFSPAELERVAKLAEEITAPAGTLLMDQGKPGQECYVILEGQAAVIVGEHRVATLQSGSTVGEMALIDHRPRSAAVRAVTDMRLLKFNAEKFQQLLTEMPKAAQRIMADLNEKLRNQNLS